ncbi:arylsulfatase [Thalassotalea eurytherma]|uniref:Arylsulfatase n=1 Tax=Thalassotalea eurytherma TaxID=1144278 RepID=A0ABQ6H5K2_9GAMM|nr:arylsulfatase [Thalassotalea eurytherma]GLX83428.1 arylsulfatase [Thalassotalea eurytherma]
MKFNKHLGLVATALLAVSSLAHATTDKSRPNILAIWGDDIGVHNISAYNHGIMGYQTPNIDRIANEGALFTDSYAQNSCTAGRAAFMMGQHPFRTGMLTIGMPGSKHGIPDWTPTIAGLLKERGYITAQHGKNHFGDQDNHLPTAHGFDQFYGNLYHLNAEEEPETYYYPKDPEFKRKYGPRGVIKSYADGRVEDTGPMTRKRMENADEEFLAATLKFIDKAHKEKKPFFIWHNSTRMHVWTRLKPESVGRTGVGLYADGMVEHDDQVGVLLDKLDDLKIADNTIVLYSTDNGAETVSWPDGGITPFHGEKGTTWEGGFRIPSLIRWPGKVKPGTKFNGMMSHEDWMPTLLSAAGVKDLSDKLRKGHKANGKTFKVHLDGYDYTPYLTGETDQVPRDAIYYFGAEGELNAVRWNDWKVHFATQVGPINQAFRFVPQWPVVINLKADPYEVMWEESEMYLRWYADNMWLFVPIQQKVGEFLGTIEGYPFQPGASLSAAGIDYKFLAEQKMKKKIAELEKAVSR